MTMARADLRYQERLAIERTSEQWIPVDLKEMKSRTAESSGRYAASGLSRLVTKAVCASSPWPTWAMFDSVDQWDEHRPCY
jgi:hypothetical protein